jgi:simple sugar transport system permease protein/ribose transport system permease protein
MPKHLKAFARRQEFWLAILFVVLFVGLSIARPNFLSLQNGVDLISSYAYTGILVSAMLVVLVAGGIDISFAAVATVAQYTAMTVANTWDIGWLGVILIAAAIGIILGVINGLLINILGLSAIIVTIATQSVIFGLILTVTKGQDIFSLPEWFTDGVAIPFHTTPDGYQYFINVQMIGLAIALALTWFVLNRTNVGRQIYAMGGNVEAARRIGYNVFRLNLFVYGYMGLAAGLASIVHAQYNMSVSPTALVGRELDVIAAAFLGGASATGGSGTILGVVLGIALVAVVQNGLTLLGVSSYWSQFFTGIIIVVAVASMARDVRRRWYDNPGAA